MMLGDECAVADCSKLRHKSSKWCGMHEARMYRRGSLELLMKEQKKSAVKGEAHWNWKNETTYHGVHFRLKRMRGSASNFTCDCGVQAKEWAYDYTDPTPLLGTDPRNPARSFVYSVDLDRYQPLCVKCHNKRDVVHHS